MTRKTGRIVCTVIGGLIGLVGALIADKAESKAEKRVLDDTNEVEKSIDKEVSKIEEDIKELDEIIESPDADETSVTLAKSVKESKNVDIAMLRKVVADCKYDDSKRFKRWRFINGLFALVHIRLWVEIGYLFSCVFTDYFED